MNHKNNKVALVTGGAKRIGALICRYLALQGWRIIIHCNDSEKDAIALCKEISTTTGAIVIKQNLLLTDCAKKIFSQIPPQYSTPSLLINNASLFENDHVTTLSEKSLQEHMQVNCIAPLLISKEFAAINKATESKSNIINILDSTIPFFYEHSFFSYSVSKMCLGFASDVLSKQIDKSCKVNSISLGFVMESQNQSKKSFHKMINTHGKNTKTDVHVIYSAIDKILSSNVNGENISL